MNIQEIIKYGLDRDIEEPAEFPNGMLLNVGAGNKVIPNLISIDYPEWDADTDSIPYPADYFAGIHCYHFLEHVRHPIKVLQEFQRVLIPGGIVNILVPYYTSQMQHHDLDHKNFFCEETWRVLFGNPYYDKNKIVWELKVHFNLIVGIVERNLSLFTQLIKGE